MVDSGCSIGNLVLVDLWEGRWWDFKRRVEFCRYCYANSPRLHKFMEGLLFHGIGFLCFNVPSFAFLCSSTSSYY